MADRPRDLTSTEGPSWGHSKVVLGAIRSFLEPFCGHLSPKIDKVSEELTVRYPHEEPCVALQQTGSEFDSCGGYLAYWGEGGHGAARWRKKKARLTEQTKRSSPREVSFRSGGFPPPQVSAACSLGAGMRALVPLPALSQRHVHARPFVGAFQVRSWSYWFVVGAILWAFIAKNKVSEKLTLRYPHEVPCVGRTVLPPALQNLAHKNPPPPRTLGMSFLWGPREGSFHTKKLPRTLHKAHA